MNLQEIHREFFRFRNGVVAQAFLDAGSPYKRVFGLQLPLLAAIAREIGSDSATAEALWAERDCRESRLLACYLFDREKTNWSRARDLALSVQTREEADILAFRLLRYLPFARDLAADLTQETSPLPRYVGEALSRNLT